MQHALNSHSLFKPVSVLFLLSLFLLSLGFGRANDVHAKSASVPAAGGVIGQDDRKQITPVYDQPWRMIVYLDFSFPSGGEQCTGWVAGPNIIGTAAHCIYKPDLGGWANSVFVSIGRDDINGIDSDTIDLTTSQCTANTSSCGLSRKNINYIPTGWVSDVSYDYGAIILPSDKTYLAQRAGWFIAQNSTDQEVANRLFNWSGYPGTPPLSKPVATLWNAVGSIYAYDASKFWTQVTITEGESGGPVWYQDGIRYYVEGINDAGSWLLPFNFAKRIDSTALADYLDWGAEVNPQICHKLLIINNQINISAVVPTNQQWSGYRCRNDVDDLFTEGSKVTLTYTGTIPTDEQLVWQGTDNDASTSNVNTVTMSYDKNVWITFKPTLVPTYTISGTVRDGNNNPIQGVSISTGNQSATTDNSGQYSISGLIAGTYNLTLTKSGYQFNPSPYQYALPPSQAANFIGTLNQTGDTFDYQPTQDTYLEEAYPSTVHGSDACLSAGLEWLSAYEHVVGLLKFGGLTSDTNLQGKIVYSAVLNLYASSVTANTNLRLWEIGNSTYGGWNESTTFASFPYASFNWYNGTGQGMQGSITIPVSTSNQGTWISTGLGTASTMLKSGVQAIINGTDPNDGFLLDNYYSNVDSDPCFSSREGSHPPVLELKVLTGTPDLVVSSTTTNPAPSNVNQFTVGQSIDINYTIFNNGPGGADYTRAAAYLGTTPTDFSDYLGDNPTQQLLSGNSDSRTVSYTFTQNDLGSRYIIVKADYQNAVSETNETNNVALIGPLNIVSPPPVDTAPSISGIPDVSLNENTSSNHAVDLWAYAADAESADSDLSFVIDNAPDPLAGVSVDSNRYIDVSPALNWNGSVNVTIRVYDPQGLSSTDTFKVTVNHVNQPPWISPPVPDQTALVNQPITLDLTPYEHDVEDSGTALNWTATGMVNCAYTGANSANDVLTFTPTSGFVGSDVITLHLTDSNGAEATQDVTLTWATSVGSPNMNVQGSGNSIPNGNIVPSTANSTDFGSVSVSGGIVSSIFTITNTGTANLDLTGNPLVQISGVNASDFTITSQPVSMITSPSGASTFTVTFQPGAAGLRTATISIPNNQLGENPYAFNVQGTGAPPSTLNVQTIIDNSTVFPNNVTSVNMAVGDLTNDGVPDIVITKGAEENMAGVAVFQGSGVTWDNGTLLAGVTQNNAYNPIIAPIRNDGKNWLVFPEHVIGNTNEWLRGFRYSGTTLVENQDITGKIGSPSWFAPAVADLNGDGKLEVWFVDNQNANHLFRAAWDLVSQTYPNEEIKAGTVNGEPVLRPMAGDFKGDGSQSLVWMVNSNELDLVTYTPGSGSFDHTSSPIFSPTDGITAFGTGNFDSLPGTDIAVATWNGAASSIYLISGKTFTSTLVATGIGELIHSIAIGDLDGNSIGEIYAAGANGGVYGYDNMNGWRLLTSQVGISWSDGAVTRWPGEAKDTVLFVGMAGGRTFRVISLSAQLAPSIYYTIFGNAGIAGATLNYGSGYTTSGGDGSYAMTVPYGWTGTVTPALSGYSFTPDHEDYSNVTANRTQNYAATLRTYTISGNAAVAGATMTYPGGSTTTNSSGNYMIAVHYGWSGTVTPSKTGYTFSPDHKDYSSITTNQSQNYTAILNTYTISSNADIAGATITYNGGSTVTDGSGNYVFTVPYGWSGTTTPSEPGYTFTPDHIDYTNVTVDQTGQDFSPIAAAGFTDVPSGYWAYSWIDRLYNAGITGGCSTSPLNYCPDSNVTRDQMAVFLERGMHTSNFSPPIVPLTFTDTTRNFAQYWIEALKSDGITSGCGSGLYCPTSPTTRAQMAVFLLKSEHGTGYTPPPATGTKFTDVPASNWAADWIEQLANEGITSGCATNLYCPDQSVTRAQMAVFLVKTFNLP